MLIAVSPEIITAVNKADLKKRKCDFDNSSIANTIPPSGVLNAAARPDAAPTTIAFFLDTLGHQYGKALLIAVKIEAAICMVGPSLPAIPPPNTLKRLEMIFTTTMRMLKSFFKR